ncbi:MAG: hemerythrin domain-containing protein [Tissierellia bacterium]|nr:hemerythrin domain-containing protein [Tissierellia bacterium]
MIYGIESLMEDHQDILRLTRVIKSLLKDQLEGEKDLPLGDLRRIVDFIRTYADDHHHGKEEKILFQYMLEELGSPAEKIVRQGMLVDHDQARSAIYKLDQALGAYEKDPSLENRLDIIGYSHRYADLLEDHVFREDKVVYPFALRELSQDSLDRVDKESRAFNEAAQKEGLQKKYKDLLKELEETYL